MDDILSTQEAATFLKICEQRVRQLAKAKKIGRKVGERQWVFTRSELVKFSKLDRPPHRPKSAKKPRKR